MPRRRLPRPGKDYLEHILEGWSYAMLSREDRWRTRMSERTRLMAMMNLPTRRQLISRVVISFGGAAAGSRGVWGEAEEEISRMSEYIYEASEITASRKRWYEALTKTNRFDTAILLSA